MVVGAIEDVLAGNTMPLGGTPSVMAARGALSMRSTPLALSAIRYLPPAPAVRCTVPTRGNIMTDSWCH